MKSFFSGGRTRASSLGFTLIEILIIIILFAILVGAGVANYYRLNRRKLVEGSARQTEQLIRTAQKNAASGVKPAGWCTDPNTLASYTIGMNRWGLPNDGYEIRAECSDGSFISVESGTLPEGTRFRYNRFVTFPVLDGVVTFNGTRQEVCLSNFVSCTSAGNIRYELVVTSGGSVSFHRL